MEDVLDHYGGVYVYVGINTLFLGVKRDKQKFFLLILLSVLWGAGFSLINLY